MQESYNKIAELKKAIGKVFAKIRKSNKKKKSLSKLAYEYDIDKGTLSKLERGIYDCRLSTAIKVSEANGIKFSDFAKMLEDELGESFVFIDE